MHRIYLGTGSSDAVESCCLRGVISWRRTALFGSQFNYRGWCQLRRPLTPTKLRRHVPENALDRVRVVLHPELVRHRE